MINDHAVVHAQRFERVLSRHKAGTVYLQISRKQAAYLNQRAFTKDDAIRVHQKNQAISLYSTKNF